MKSRTIPMTSRIILFYVLGVFGHLAMGMDEQASSSMHNQRINSMGVLGFDEPSEKRAYTYVSEYKRLPVYNFGIGKRWADSGDDKRGRQYSFGLGKRAIPYSFGLGKRNQEYNPMKMSLDYSPVDAFEGAHSQEETLSDFLEDKRSRQPYSFGLGKRTWSSSSGESMGTGKRPNDGFNQRYHFGLGKRMAEEEDSMQ